MKQNQKLEIKLTDAQVVVQDQLILDKLNWHFRGEHWQITGANGSGKTTFLKLVAGLIWPTPPASRSYYDGHNWQSSPISFKHKISFVSNFAHSFYRRHHSRRLAKVVAFAGLRNQPLLYHQPTEKEFNHIEKLLPSFGIEHLLNKSIGQLSDGQLKKLLLFKALLSNPSLLLLDEPFNDLDKTNLFEIKEILTQISKKTAIIFTNHRPGLFNLPQQKSMAMAQPNITKKYNIPVIDFQLTKPSWQKSFVCDSVDIYLNHQLVLKQITWQVGANENWLITGENGSGKSTLLRTLYAMHPPANNKHIIYFDHPHLTPVNIIRQRIGWVAASLQDSYTYDISLFDFICSGLSDSIGIYRVFDEKEKKRVLNLLDLFALAPLAQKSIRSLSYGELRLAMIVRALIKEPHVLLLDEPLNGLDQEHSNLIKNVLMHLTKVGLQIILTSHRSADHFLWFKHQLHLQNGDATMKIL